MNAHNFNESFSKKVRTERRITNEILRDIVVCEANKYYLELAFSSVFEWLTKGHNYSNSAAHRRLEAARLMRALPEISSKLEEGEITLSNSAMAQTYFRNQEKISGKIQPGLKKEIVESLEKKSKVEAEQVLMEHFPEAATKVKSDHKAVVDENTTRLSQNFSNEDMKILERVRDLLSHSVPSGRFSDVIIYLANDFINRKDPLNKKGSKQTKVHVHQMAKGKCIYTDPVTGKVCGSSFQLEVDHIQMRVLGGSDQLENLRGFCRAHNQYMSEKTLGRFAANRWRYAGST